MGRVRRGDREWSVCMLSTAHPSHVHATDRVS